MECFSGSRSSSDERPSHRPKSHHGKHHDNHHGNHQDNHHGNHHRASVSGGNALDVFQATVYAESTDNVKKAKKMLVQAAENDWVVQDLKDTQIKSLNKHQVKI